MMVKLNQMLEWFLIIDCFGVDYGFLVNYFNERLKKKKKEKKGKKKKKR